MRAIEEIIIHCSASDRPEDGIEKMRQLHTCGKDEALNWSGRIVRCRGFDDIAYHYIIDPRGSIVLGRDLEVMGAHCRRRNKHSIGICLMGLHTFDSYQLGVARNLIADLCSIYKLDPRTDVQPHNKYRSDKLCPNFDIAVLLPKRSDEVTVLQALDKLDERVVKLEKRKWWQWR